MAFDILVNFAKPHETAVTRLGDRVQVGLNLYEYVRFESNITENSVVAVSPTGVASAATNTSTGRIGVVPYAVTASAGSPRFGWILRRGVVTARAGAGTAGNQPYLTTTAGELGTTGTAVPMARFVTAASGGTAQVCLAEAVAI